jgi:hypothetical protein
MDELEMQKHEQRIIVLEMEVTGIKATLAKVSTLLEKLVEDRHNDQQNAIALRENTIAIRERTDVLAAQSEKQDTQIVDISKKYVDMSLVLERLVVKFNLIQWIGGTVSAFLLTIIGILISHFI